MRVSFYEWGGFFFTLSWFNITYPVRICDEHDIIVLSNVVFLSFPIEVVILITSWPSKLENLSFQLSLNVGW